MGGVIKYAAIVSEKTDMFEDNSNYAATPVKYQPYFLQDLSFVQHSSSPVHSAYDSTVDRPENSIATGCRIDSTHQ